MKKTKSRWWMLMMMLPAMYIGQTYQWQWAKQAGGQTGSVGSAFSYFDDESIRDIVVDNNNNTYYLASIRAQGQNLNGVPVTNYGLSDLFLFSTDCQGNIRWSRTIGGSGFNEFAWNIEVDNSGGLYIMTNLTNEGSVYQPSSVSVHFDETQTIPAISATDATTIDPGAKTGYLLKYNTTDGTLNWTKPLQGDVNLSLRQCDSQMMYMDSSKNIHAILGFKAGTHLGGLITVPPTFTTTFQYYLVKFNYDNGNMTPTAPVLLPITGDLSISLFDGKINMLFDESLNRYYLTGKRRQSSSGSLVDFTFNNIPFTNEAYLLAFDVSGGSVTEAWRREINTGRAIPDEEIHSIIKDSGSSDIYISGRYYALGETVTFGTYTFPTPSYSGQKPFVMKLNSNGGVQWAKIADGMSNGEGYRFIKGLIAQNSNEIGFATGSRSDTWGSYTMTRPNGEPADPLLVRLNKDTGAVLGAAEVVSNLGSQDEFTAIAVDNDGNYVLGGFFHQQLFTDPNDNVSTMILNVPGNKSQNFFTKYSKSVCSQLSIEETSAQADIQVYPNPVQDVLNIKSKVQLVSYELYGATGQMVKRGELSSAQEQIVLSSLPTGIYYIKLKTSSATVTEKIIKK